jgi:hypothetical protein
MFRLKERVYLSVPLRSNVPKVDEAKEPNKSSQPFEISGDLSLSLSNDHQLCYLYLHYECSLRPVFDGEGHLINIMTL